MVASGFDYLFHFVQLSDKSQKRLKGIYQMKLGENGKISIDAICEYDYLKDGWKFYNIISDEIESFGLESNAEAFNAMKEELLMLSEHELVQ